ncbi:hypothetical protein LXL04_007619 [Taraxacum kok-saghyz]
MDSNSTGFKPCADHNTCRRRPPPATYLFVVGDDPHTTARVHSTACLHHLRRSPDESLVLAPPRLSLALRSVGFRRHSLQIVTSCSRRRLQIHRLRRISSPLLLRRPPIYCTTDDNHLRSAASRSVQICKIPASFQVCPPKTSSPSPLL